MPSARFRPADRVVSPRDYARLRRRGKRLASKNFAVSIAKRDKKMDESDGRCPRGGVGHPSQSRLGLSVSRRVGNAVVRNRVKRAVREWFRNSRSGLPQDVDIVVIARRGAADCRSGEIAGELNALLASRAARAKLGASFVMAEESGSIR